MSPVIVVGGGAAGLAAAFRLRRAGHAVRLLEAAPVIGGKLRSHERDGFLIDQGAFFIPSSYQRMVGLAVEAGFADQLEAKGTRLGVAREGRVHEIDIAAPLGGFLRTELFSASSKAALLKLVPELWRTRYAGFERLPEAACFDREVATDWARRSLGDEQADYVVGLILRGMSGADPQTSSRVEFLTLLSLLSGARLLACRGGMGAYAARLAEGIEVQTHAQVRQVQPRGEGVEVIWADAENREHVEHVAGCVVAGSVETAVAVLPQLDSWRRDYLGRVRDTRMCIVHVALSRPPPQLGATYVLVPRPSHPFLCGVCSDHHKADGRVPPGKGLLSLMPLASWGERVYHDEDARIADAALQALDTVLPGAAREVEFVEVSRWTQRYNPPGHYRELGAFRARCERDTRIQLAGDYYGYANLETAIRSGERAAQALAVALPAT